MRSSRIAGGAEAADEVDAVLATLRKAFDVPVATVRHLSERSGVDPGPSMFERLPVEAGRLVLVPDAAKDPRFTGVRVGCDGPPLRFFAGVPLCALDGTRRGALCLLDARPRRLGAEGQALLIRMAGVVSLLLGRVDEGRAAPVVHAHGPSAANLHRLSDRCAGLARIGVWACDLRTEALTWTDGVYDLFDLPRGSPVTRAMTKSFYDDPSCREMERLRSLAIAHRNSFTLDIRITTPKGRARWIRLSADVECEAGVPVRLFGVKQDITPEKKRMGRLRDLAERDALTGLANRRAFEVRLAAAAMDRPGEPGLAAVLVVDVDRFKAVNDTFGHATGDACLKRIGAALRDVFGPTSLAARLGGDEFAVLLFGRMTAADVAGAVERLMAMDRHVVSRDGEALTVGISVGVALSAGPDSPVDIQDLLDRSDRALYCAKASGRDTFRIDASNAIAVPAQTGPVRPQPRAGLPALAM